MRAGNATTKIAWVNGGIDPWHTLSVLPGELAGGTDGGTVFMPASAHCRAMQGSRANDPDEVKQARIQTAAFVDAWLAE